MKTRNNIRGFTLIEMMIVVAFIAILLMAAGPSIRVYLENSKVRGVPESIVAGIQIARFNAVKTNRLTQFALTTGVVNGATVNNGWIVREQMPTTPPSVGTVETFVWGVGGNNWITVGAVATDSGGNLANAVTFNGAGQLVSPNAPWTAPVATVNPIEQIAVTSNTGMTGVVPLRVEVNRARGTRVCVPHLDGTGDPKACTP